MEKILHFINTLIIIQNILETVSRCQLAFITIILPNDLVLKLH